MDETTVAADPIAQFALWYDEARAAEIVEPNAMTVATVGADGTPSARVVLLKGVDADGFLFYTNYESRKGRELAANPRAALVFFWAELERQVRVVGTASRVSRAESQRYFESRPRGSRLGAWASSQSEVIAGRAVLAERMSELEQRYADQDIPLPPYWGGLRVRPATIEFWQGRPNRLHDRLRYTRNPNDTWTIERLAP